MKLTRDNVYTILIGLYIGGIMTGNAMAGKLISIGAVNVTVGFIGIPLVYLTRDFLNELFGPKEVLKVVWAGLIADGVLLLLTTVARSFEAAPYGVSDDAFNAVFGHTPRIVVASMSAYLVCAYLDVWIFNKIRERTGEAKFWLRKNVSTGVSQLIDSLMFCLIAFAGVVPMAPLLSMALAQYVMKMIWSPLGTPFSLYLMRAAGLKRAD